jgi:catechol 2,3-dioxygenase-like lactoylglutathione lyase family enzyme
VDAYSKALKKYCSARAKVLRMRLDHVALWAVDIELMRAFYEKYFDATSSPRYENERKRFTSYFLTFPGGGRLPRWTPKTGQSWTAENRPVR